MALNIKVKLTLLERHFCLPVRRCEYDMTSTARHIMQHAQLILTHFWREMTFWINAASLFRPNSHWFPIRTTVPCGLIAHLGCSRTRWRSYSSQGIPSSATHPQTCWPNSMHFHAWKKFCQNDQLGTICHWKAFELPCVTDANGPWELPEGSYRWGYNSRTEAVVPSPCRDRDEKLGPSAVLQPGLST